MNSDVEIKKRSVSFEYTPFVVVGGGVNYRDICIIVTDILPAFVARTIYVPGVSEDAS